MPFCASSDANPSTRPKCEPMLTQKITRPVIGAGTVPDADEEDELDSADKDEEEEEEEAELREDDDDWEAKDDDEDDAAVAPAPATAGVTDGARGRIPEGERDAVDAPLGSTV
jgi:hypothetical protein